MFPLYHSLRILLYSPSSLSFSFSLLFSSLSSFLPSLSSRFVCLCTFVSIRLSVSVSLRPQPYQTFSVFLVYKSTEFRWFSPRVGWVFRRVTGGWSRWGRSSGVGIVLRSLSDRGTQWLRVRTRIVHRLCKGLQRYGCPFPRSDWGDRPKRTLMSFSPGGLYLKTFEDHTWSFPLVFGRPGSSIFCRRLFRFSPKWHRITRKTGGKKTTKGTREKESFWGTDEWRPTQVIKSTSKKEKDKKRKVEVSSEKEDEDFCCPTHSRDRGPRPPGCPMD